MDSMRLTPEKRFKFLRVGNVLLWLFLITTVAALCRYVPVLIREIPARDYSSLPAVIGIAVAEAVVFWAGIIIVYITSVQLGFKTRIWGAVLGMVPIANLIMLFIILRVTGKEARNELARCRLNQSRADERVCATRYPLLMVHGVFFRDFKHIDYWGRIPDELIRNGATLFYGEQHSAASVDDCAKELEARILHLVRENGFEKFNVIAHSKGGLDMRTALAKTSVAPYVASLTTVNTPHRGCEFADYLIDKIPEHMQQSLARTYNRAAAALGDSDPDFMAAVRDLTASACRKRNEDVKDVEGVYYQSFGSVLRKSRAGRFPLNMTSHLVKLFDGKNDGLVGESSFPWGERCEILRTTGRRGISHGDVIDLNRENFDGFDVREFFVQMVADLKRQGF